jgi:long-chain acyl-CoA synthetase
MTTEQAYRAGQRLAGRFPADAVALSTPARTLTFGELDDRADRVAAGLLAAGLVPADRVLALLPNGPEIFDLLIGCARAGLILVPMNWRLAPDELGGVAADAGAAALFVHASFDGVAGPLAAACRPPALHVRVGDAPGPDGPVDYEHWISRQPSAAAPARSAAAGDVVLQVYTSGTTAAPKGVLLTHGNLAAKVPQAARLWDLHPGSVSLLATPLFHIGGLSWGLIGLHAGARTLVSGRAGAADLAVLLRRERVTHSFLVPTMLQDLCDQAGGTGFPDLAAIVFGAAPLPERTHRAALEVFRCALIHVYGLTETTGAITQAASRPGVGRDAWSPLRSAGRPFPWVELTVREPSTGRTLPPGAAGEVWTRSAQNTPGYAGRPAATAELLTADGWLRTGDGGYLDSRGYLYLTDRLKDMIVTGGENVYPAEVEAVLGRHRDVAEVAVIGLPDPRWGESVTAVVVPRAGSDLRPDDVVAYTAGRLASYKRPRAAFLVAALPRNVTGKVAKKQLIAALTSNGRGPS